MAIFNCLVMFLMAKKKKSKMPIKAADACDEGISSGKLQVKPVNNTSLSTENHVQESHLTTSKASPSQEKRSFFIPKVLSDDSLVRAEFFGEAAYEGGDEHDEIGSMKRDYSDFDLQAKGEPFSCGLNAELNNLTPKNNMEMEEWINVATMDASGHVSDPGMVRTAFWGSPVLKRSCSNIETKRVNKSINSVKWLSSYNNFQNLLENGKGGISYEGYSTPLTVKSSCSADRVMLKKRSSCQVLPSRSRKIWWKLFLWSHRNLHKPSAPKKLLDFSTTKPKFGYSSDTHEPCKKLDNKKKKTIEAQNQWLAFSLESSSFDRVNAWVNSLDDSTFYGIDGEENINDLENVGSCGPHQFDIGESSMKNHSHASRHVVEDVLQANNIIQSLNSFSSVAHISGIGLKVIPSISAFINLKTVNLSANFIAHISPFTLPKSLHTLDLSRNKISVIEGLRDLTRLRVLNLSYNRISRIGHGLSNCTIIKELYLAGNKISEVEGLHRLLKLTVFDLGFNKITTTKALGQLVANYNSLMALNLVGNPLQNNIGDEQMRKAVLSLLPNIAYLNKLPIRQQRAREVMLSSLTKSALGDNGRTLRRRPTKRAVQSLGPSAKSKLGEGSSKNHRSKSRKQQYSSQRK